MELIGCKDFLDIVNPAENIQEVILGSVDTELLDIFRMKLCEPIYREVIIEILDTFIGGYEILP